MFLSYCMKHNDFCSFFSQFEREHFGCRHQKVHKHGSFPAAHERYERIVLPVIVYNSNLFMLLPRYRYSIEHAVFRPFRFFCRSSSHSLLLLSESISNSLFSSEEYDDPRSHFLDSKAVVLNFRSPRQEANVGRRLDTRAAPPFGWRSGPISENLSPNRMLTQHSCQIGAPR